MKRILCSIAFIAILFLSSCGPSRYVDVGADYRTYYGPRPYYNPRPFYNPYYYHYDNPAWGFPHHPGYYHHHF